MVFARMNLIYEAVTSDTVLEDIRVSEKADNIRYLIVLKKVKLYQGHCGRLQEPSNPYTADLVDLQELVMEYMSASGKSSTM